LSSVQRPRRLGGDKKKERKKERKKHWQNISPPTYYVGRPKDIRRKKMAIKPKSTDDYVGA